MVEICQLIIRGQLPSLTGAASKNRMDKMIEVVTGQSMDTIIRSNKKLGVKEQGTGCFQVFAAEGSGNDTEILMEGITLCPEGGKVTVHEMDGDIVLDVGDMGKELSLVFKGRDATELLLSVAKLLHGRLSANPKLPGISDYLHPVDSGEKS